MARALQHLWIKIESEWLREVDADLPNWMGNDSWEVPLPATYVIDRDGNIVWSLVSNDATLCAEMEEIAAAIPGLKETTSSGPKRTSCRKRLTSTFKKMKDVKTKFGKKDKPAMEFLGDYMISSPA